MAHKPRLTAIESLRGMAFLAVVLQHSIAHYGYLPTNTFADGVIMTVLLMLSKFAVPAFIFITGMVLFYNYEDRFNSRMFLKRRLTDIVLPYIIWSIIYICYYTWKTSGFAGLTSLDPGKVSMQLLTGKSSSHLWYITMLMQFYLLFPLIRLGIVKLKNKYKKTTLLVILLTAGVVYLVLMFYRGKIAAWAELVDLPFLTPWLSTYADRNVVNFFFYFLLGAAAGLYPHWWETLVLKSKLLMLSLFILLSGYYVIIISQKAHTPEGLLFNYNRVSLLRPDMALYLVISIFVFYLLAMQISKGSLARMFGLIGTLSFGGYLMHMLMLAASYKIESAWYGSLNVTVKMLLTFMIASILSLCVTRLIAYLQVGKWTAGIYMPNHKNKQMMSN